MEAQRHGKGEEETGKKRKRRLSDTAVNKAKKQPWCVCGNTLVAIALHQRDDAVCSVRKQLVICRAELLSNAANCISIPFALD